MTLSPFDYALQLVAKLKENAASNMPGNNSEAIDRYTYDLIDINKEISELRAEIEELEKDLIHHYGDHSESILQKIEGKQVLEALGVATDDDRKEIERLRVQFFHSLQITGHDIYNELLTSKALMKSLHSDRRQCKQYLTEERSFATVPLMHMLPQEELLVFALLQLAFEKTNPDSYSRLEVIAPRRGKVNDLKTIESQTKQAIDYHEENEKKKPFNVTDQYLCLTDETACHTMQQFVFTQQIEALKKSLAIITQNLPTCNTRSGSAYVVYGPQDGEKLSDYPLFDLCEKLSSPASEHQVSALQFSDDGQIMTMSRYNLLTDVTADNFDEKTAQRPIKRKVYLLTNNGLAEIREKLGVNSQNLQRD
ncbi:MAG: hypothetical protein SFW63_07820 [Alphaproteobacteria bacterium]|nr:hypothetical protein [Alphaproteobacteria bacterium]